MLTLKNFATPKGRWSLWRLCGSAMFAPGIHSLWRGYCSPWLGIYMGKDSFITFFALPLAHHRGTQPIFHNLLFTDPSPPSWYSTHLSSLQRGNGRRSEGSKGAVIVDRFHEPRRAPLY